MMRVLVLLLITAALVAAVACGRSDPPTIEVESDPASPPTQTSTPPPIIPKYPAPMRSPTEAPMVTPTQTPESTATTTPTPTPTPTFTPIPTPTCADDEERLEDGTCHRVFPPETCWMNNQLSFADPNCLTPPPTPTPTTTSTPMPILAPCTDDEIQREDGTCMPEPEHEHMSDRPPTPPASLF